MGMQINTNVAALNAYRNLSNTQNDLSKSLEKLSSGLRINRAADDAAGLAISEGLRSQVNGLAVAARNAQDGISVIQTAEGALTEAHSILQRLRDLAVQAGNDSNSTNSRTALKNEADELVAELGRISESTNFNGIKLLDGSAGTLNFQVGADGDTASQIGVNLGSANVASTAAALSVNNGSTFAIADLALVDGVQTFTAEDASGAAIATASVDLGAAAAGRTLDDVVSALNADTNFARNFTASKNDAGDLVVKSNTGAVVDTDTGPGTGVAGGVQGATAAIDFSTAAGAQSAITAISAQIDSISAARANLGAQQNRFESTINSLNVSRENLAAAESRIRDTDMAAEMVNFSRANILAQAGTAMLAQANASTQGVLQLLG